MCLCPIEKCYSHRLRRKLLETTNVTLQRLQEMALSLENSERQARTMGNHKSVSETVNRLRPRQKEGSYSASSKKTASCWACGSTKHFKKDSSCPAKGKKCNRFSNIGHFEKFCMTKFPNAKKPHKEKDKKRHYVKTVEEGEAHPSCDDDTDYAFGINQKLEVEKVLINIGGVDIRVIIDSGATVNIVNRKLWEELKREKINCDSSVKTKNLYAYGSAKPLTVAGCFTTNVQFRDRIVQGECFVAEEKGQPLIGKQTASELGILKIEMTENINRIEGNELKLKLKEKFPACFNGMGKLKDFQLGIPIDDSVKPVIQPVRRVPFHLREKLEKRFDELEDSDIIEEVNEPSNWVSPVVVVPKGHDGSHIRLCVDMRQANAAIIRERFPIPTVDEVLQDLNESKIFSRIDIKMAYHQIEMKPDSREITTFMTQKGFYRHKRLNFGISCAPENYNKIIMQVLQGLEGVNSIFDDIVVHAATYEENTERVEKVLERLEQNGLTVNENKCEFCMPSTEFMGHLLSEHGIGPTESKVQDILNARRPESAAEVISFLGLVNFSARYIPDLSTVAEPLRKFTRQGVPFKWGRKEEESFNELKRRLANSETLGYFNKNAKTKVISGASSVGLGQVLVQDQGRELRVISYASRTLSKIERKFSQTEREALGIVWSCERFHMYLFGQEFELLTDHKPLEFIFSSKSKPCARVERWVLRLQPYNYTVRHISGSSNITDSLSRLLNRSEESTENSETEAYLRTVVENATPMAMNIKDIEQASRDDEVSKDIKACIMTGNWNKVEYNEYLTVKDKLCAVGDIILRGTRIVIPEKLRAQVLKLGHEGHPGIVVMKQRLRTKVWWPGIDKAVERSCRTCYRFQLMGKPNRPKPMKRTDLPTGLWEQISCDFLGPLPSKDNLLVITDYYSRWIEVVILKSTTADKTVEVLNRILCMHGYPQFQSPRIMGQIYKSDIQRLYERTWHISP